MPPRLNKRQQRELEELEALAGPQKQSVSESSDDETVPLKNKGLFTVASLLAQNNDDDDDDEDSTEAIKKSKKSKKKKKKPTTGSNVPTSSEQTTSIKTTSAALPAKATTTTTTPETKTEPRDDLTATERKALKKAKQKEKRSKGDEIEKALAELSIQLPTRTNLSQPTSKGQSLTDLLGVSLQHLDAEAELRKFFGSRVVQAAKTQSSSSPSRRNAGVLRSNLTRPRPTWWSASQREGLSIRPLSQEEVQTKLNQHSWEAVDEKWWTVEYSKKYKSMTKAFMRTVVSGDPQGFYELLRKLPWHADTLLQLSEVYRHREEHAQAVDFIDRALFTYERSFIGAFNLTGGINRLDFDRVENRPFFLAIHRQVVDLQRRGCIRTAFEFARLLYSLDPWTDPHGSLLHLDQIAIKANMAQWLIDVYDTFDQQQQQHHSSSSFNPKNLRLDPTFLPGWAYSRALALHLIEDKADNDRSTASTKALTEAVQNFPSVVPLLADKLEVELEPFVRSHPECKIELDGSSLVDHVGVLHVLSHLYVQRSWSIWKDHAAWFAETVNATFSSSSSSSLLSTSTSKSTITTNTNTNTNTKRSSFLSLFSNSEDLRWSIYRHIIVLESTYPRLLPFIPKHVLKEKAFSCDPLPPKNAVTSYNDETFFEGTDDVFALDRNRTRTRREREMDRRRLAQMVPDAAFRQQLEAFFEAQGLEQRFPGGILHFAQAMAQLPPQELEELLMNGMLMGEAGAGVLDPGFFVVGGVRMPGQMPGEEDMLAGLPGIVDNEGGGGNVNAGRLPLADAAVLGGPMEEIDNDEAMEDEDDDEDEDEEEEYIAPMPRMIRNLLGRLWGRQPNRNEESSSSEDENDDGDDNVADLDAVD